MEQHHPGTFVAIDFETLRAHSSVNGKSYNHLPLSVGVVQYIDGVEVQRFHSLVNPETTDTGWVGVKSGITPCMAAHAPVWPEVWLQIKRYFLTDISIPIVAYNCSTEQSVLLDMRSIYGIPADDAMCIKEMDLFCFFHDLISLHWIDPYSMLKQSGEKNLKLGEVCARRGITFQEHNALGDAWACAQLYLKLIGEEELLPQEQATTRREPSRRVQKQQTEDFEYSELSEDVSSFFNKKKVLVTGFGDNGSEVKETIHRVLRSHGASVVKNMPVRGLDILICKDPKVSFSKVEKAGAQGSVIIGERQMKEIFAELGEASALVVL